MINPKTGKRLVLVLDTVDPEAPPPGELWAVEDWLDTLTRWEAADPAADAERGLVPLELPAPLAGGRALAAWQRVRVTVQTAQGQAAIEAGLTGRQYARVIDRRWGMPPGSSMELAPLRAIDVDQDDADTLTALAQVLTRVLADPGHPAAADIADAADQAAAAYDLEAGDLHQTVARIAAMLAAEPDAEWDGPVRELAAAIAACPPAADLELTASQAAAYRHVCALQVRAAGGDGLDMFVAGAFE
ncbi:hypothetical protein [Nonomuraea sp. NPDC050310]|uniref:hypothetical protein n=1 Tax=Nonomuraea sp. NPDC050310 TaxID=3154935 RepID=UPI0033EB0D63